jgi:mono/diheme cytochrome c family protein
VNSPVWSDGATKERYMSVPAGATITVKDCDQAPSTCLPVGQGGSPEDEGHFDLPVGTILVKVFSLLGQRIETRLLMRVSATSWKGHSYAWNDAATDATLAPDGLDRTVGTQVWHYPSESECMQCHTLSAGRSLGPSTRQLDRMTSTGNQLDQLVARGWLATRPKALSPLPEPNGTGTVEDRARSYLQANCSHCHRPGTWIGDLDMRYVASLFEMHLCNVYTQFTAGDSPVPLLRLAPGKPADSAVSFRMHDRGGGYTMPKLGSNVVDPNGTALVDRWISELPGCPEAPAP